MCCKTFKSGETKRNQRIVEGSPPVPKSHAKIAVGQEGGMPAAPSCLPAAPAAIPAA